MGYFMLDIFEDLGFMKWLASYLQDRPHPITTELQTLHAAYCEGRLQSSKKYNG